MKSTSARLLWTLETVSSPGCQSRMTSTSSNRPARIIHSLPKYFSSAGVP